MYEEIRAAINAKDPFSQYLGITIDEIRADYARASMPFEDFKRNGLGNLHGGASFTLADMAFAGVAIAKGVATVNITSTINYTAAGKAGPVTAEARLVSESRKLCTIQVNITDGSGQLIAVFTGTGYKTGKVY